MRAEGFGFKIIARTLNSEGVLSPQPPRGRGRRSRSTSSVRSVLFNERYLGKLVWNKTRKLRVPKTGRTVHRPRPETEWVCVDTPHLKIVESELFDKAHRNIRMFNQLFGRKGGRPGLAVGQQRTLYMFSGLLICALCNGPVTLVGGRYKKGIQKYGCSMHFQRGSVICENDLTIRRDELERCLLGGLQDALLSEEAIERAVVKLQREIERRCGQLDSELTTLRNREAELERENSLLIKAILVGSQSSSITAEIAKRDQELAAIRKKLLEPRKGSFQTEISDLRKFAVTHLADLRELLSKSTNVIQARAVLAEQVGKIRLQPAYLEGKRVYRAQGSIDMLGDKDLRVDGAEGRD